MVDVQNIEIHERDVVMFIRNQRGKKPQIMYGIVDAVKPKSVIVQRILGGFSSFRLSHYGDEHFTNILVLPRRPEVDGKILDFTDYPVAINDKVAFVVVPSQGFSTSFIIGEIIRLNSDEVTILVHSKAEQKYIRKPKEVVVIGQY